MRIILIMILVLLGSHDFQFNRLLIELDRLKTNNVINEEIIVQSGCTSIETDVLNLRPYILSTELDSLYDKANFIITHGGTASIIKGVKKGKRVIAVARLKKYVEVIDDHQKQIINEFVKEGYILEWREGELFENVLNRLNDFKPKKYISKRDEILMYLENYIKNN